MSDMMSDMEIGCGSIRELIPDFAASRLGAEERAMVERHVAGCADCRAELELARLILATRPVAPAGLLEGVTRVASTARRAPARTWWGVSAAAVAALALGIGIVSEDPSEANVEVPAFASEVEEGGLWLSDDGLLAGAPALDDLSDEALLQLLDELSAASTGGAA